MTVLDCCKGYWHQQLDEQSSYLTTFNTEFGRYRYTVMPFGATVAADVFQNRLDECFGHIQNVIVLADDIMIPGKSKIIKTMTKHLPPCLRWLDNAM